MCFKNVQFIADLSEHDLWTQFVSMRYPKWSTSCLLKYLHLPVLDSLLIYPSAAIDEVNRALQRFMLVDKLDRILIRTDSGRESGDYIRGGNSLDFDRAIKMTMKMLRIGRAVVAMTPTNRFNNKLTVNLGLDAEGFFHIELLGPGFDLSDLNRGLVSPELSFTISQINWMFYEKPHPLFVKQHSNCENLAEMRLQRLHRIASELLPAIGIDSKNNTESFAKNWLLENGFNALFREDRIQVSWKDIINWYEIAFLVGRTYRRYSPWKHLVISSSDLGNGRGTTYWDVINPEKKFDLP